MSACQSMAALSRATISTFQKPKPFRPVSILPRPQIWFLLARAVRLDRVSSRCGTRPPHAVFQTPRGYQCMHGAEVWVWRGSR